MVTRCHPVLPVHHLQGDPKHQLDQDVEGHVEEAGVDEAVADIAPGLEPSKANFISVKIQEQVDNTYEIMSPAWIVNQVRTVGNWTILKLLLKMFNLFTNDSYQANIANDLKTVKHKNDDLE